MTVLDALRLVARLEADQRASEARAEPDEHRAARTALVKSLSAREREVFELLARAFSQVEIAEQLAISTNTVKSHAKAINRKLGCRSPRELRRFAAGLGLGGL
jgi:DNA-binding CsgD family transcriptional regulator